jgi:hypothetical protein
MTKEETEAAGFRLVKGEGPKKRERSRTPFAIEEVLKTYRDNLAWDVENLLQGGTKRKIRGGDIRAFARLLAELRGLLDRLEAKLGAKARRKRG